MIHQSNIYKVSIVLREIGNQKLAYFLMRSSSLFKSPVEGLLISFLC